MPNLTIRQVDADVVDQIKVIAAQNGRSMQQELRLLVNRFASLPDESRRALAPLAALQVPEWYTKLWNTRLDIGAVPDAALPKRRSPFRRLDPGQVGPGQVGPGQPVPSGSRAGS